jgi:hypothetical protein
MVNEHGADRKCGQRTLVAASGVAMQAFSGCGTLEVAGCFHNYLVTLQDGYPGLVKR